MSGLIYELIDTLNAEANLYEELFVLSVEKNKSIIKSDVSELSSITRLEQGVLDKIQHTEKKRETLVYDISIVLNQNLSELTISKLALILKDHHDQYNALVDVGERIRGVLENIKKINDQNSELLKQSIEYIDFTVNAIQSSFEAPRASYDYGQNSGSVSFFDRKQ